MPLWLRRHRRAVAFVLAFAGVLLALAGLRQHDPTWEAVVVRADLPAGHVLSDGDLGTQALPTGAHPPTAIASAADAVGRVLAGPMTSGEVVLASRLVGPHLLDGMPAGTVAQSVRLEDPAEVAFLKPGDHVDVVAARRGSLTDDAAATKASTVAENASVLAIPGVEGARVSGLLGSSGDVRSGQGTVIVLGVDRRTAASLAGAAADSRLSVILRSPAASPSPGATS